MEHDFLHPAHREELEEWRTEAAAATERADGAELQVKVEERHLKAAHQHWADIQTAHAEAMQEVSSLLPAPSHSTLSLYPLTVLSPYTLISYAASCELSPGFCAGVGA